MVAKAPPILKTKTALGSFCASKKRVSTSVAAAPIQYTPSVNVCELPIVVPIVESQVSDKILLYAAFISKFTIELSESA